MAKRRWSAERKWSPSETEALFERLVKEHGYKVKAYREYLSKTDFLLEKDGFEFEWYYAEPHTTTPITKAATKYVDFLIDRLENDYKMMREIQRLESELRGE